MEIHTPGDGLPKMPQFKSGPWILPFFLIVFALSAAGTIFYQVDTEGGQVGVVQRFGKYVRTTDPGLHLKLPYGIETVKIIKTKHIFKEEFGFKTVAPGVRTVYADNFRARGNFRNNAGSDPFLQESTMLTGDLNVMIIEWIVQYTIKDPVQYAFKIRNPRGTIRNMSEAVMRLVIGDRTINQVLGSGEEVQFEAEERLQKLLDEYESGISIVDVILQNVTVPNQVKPSFDEVNQAEQEKLKVIQQAQQEYNRVIPKAKGQALQMIESAKGYALERTNRAQGDAERFLLTWEAYKEAPEVTKKRLYLEMAGKVMPNLEQKMFLDDAQKGIVPLLNLAEKGGAES